MRANSVGGWTVFEVRLPCRARKKGEGRSVPCSRVPSSEFQSSDLLSKRQYRLLFTVYYSLFTIHYSLLLFTVHCSPKLFAIRCSLFATVHCLLFSPISCPLKLWQAGFTIH